MKPASIMLCVSLAWAIGATTYAAHLYEDRSERKHATERRTHAVIQEMKRRHSERMMRRERPDYQADLQMLAMLTKRAQRLAGTERRN